MVKSGRLVRVSKWVFFLGIGGVGWYIWHVLCGYALRGMWHRTKLDVEK